MSKGLIFCSNVNAECVSMRQVIRCKHKIRSFSEMLHPRKGQLTGLAISLSNNMVEVRHSLTTRSSLHI